LNVAILTPNKTRNVTLFLASAGCKDGKNKFVNTVILALEELPSKGFQTRSMFRI
jgi:hypothetical protein